MRLGTRLQVPGRIFVLYTGRPGASVIAAAVPIPA